MHVYNLNLHALVLILFIVSLIALSICILICAFSFFSMPALLLPLIIYLWYSRC